MRTGAAYGSRTYVNSYGCKHIFKLSSDTCSHRRLLNLNVHVDVSLENGVDYSLKILNCLTFDQK